MNLQESINDLHTYPIVEEFYSIQGEGYHTGKAAYFIRFGGCNVCCGWCDVKESWNPDVHPKITIDSLIANILHNKAHSIVVTGGEPLMHDLTLFCDALKKNKIESFLETSGTHKLTGNWDWICLSPKQKHAPLAEIFPFANELKVVIANSNDFAWAEQCKQKVSKNCLLYLQPEFSVQAEITHEIVEYCKNNPEWRISLQTHKFIDIP